MRRQISRRLLDRSCNWIRTHWNAQNHEVPDELLQLWLYPCDHDDEEPMGFHLAVFAFGYVQYDLVAHNVPAGVKRSISLSEITEWFGVWQMKLGFAEIQRRTSVRSKPLPLFSFTRDERLVTWRDSDSEVAS